MPETPDMPWLDELNPQQREACTHGEGPLLVVAGAGSGKTKTLAYRVAVLIARGVPPDRILLLTFTRRAAQEMIGRAEAAMPPGTPIAGRVWGGTFHAIGSRLLRTYGKAVGLDPEFTVMDRGDTEDLIGVVRHDVVQKTVDKRFPRKSTCADIYSRTVNGTESIGEVLRRFFPWCAEWENELKVIFKAYVDRKLKQNVLDYDDLLYYWALLAGDEQMGRRLDARFDYLLVDEYQDTNKVQADILRGMRRDNRNIMAVGDDAQSIYSFRAATVRNMFDFPTIFPGTRVVTLEQNYRSVMPILDTTNRVIAAARHRYTKDLWSNRGQGQRPRLITCMDDGEQSGWVVEHVLEHREQGIPLHRQAVLFRTGYLSDQLEIGLAHARIPFHKYGGLRFLEAAHVKDLVALLKIVENPRDDMAWFRVLQLLPGIGPAGANAAIKRLDERGRDAQGLAACQPPAAARGLWPGLVSLVTDLQAAGRARPAAQVERVRKFYDPLLERLYENPKVRARDIANLEQIATRYATRLAFLTDLQLDPPTSTSDLADAADKDDDWLTLSTIHSAKGCEWDVVYLIHASDGCLPSDMAAGNDEELEEERRLTYVAMTRARDFLYVLWPQRYYHKRGRMTDRHSYAQLSRFFTRDVLATMDREQTKSRELIYETDEEAHRLDIRSRVRERWD